MDIAVFGGSFSPVHFGHYLIITEILKIGKVQKCLVIPTFQNPLKKKLSLLPERVRWKMLQETFSEIKQVELLDYELKQKKVNFTVDTLEYISHRFPKDHLYLLMGEDAFQHFSFWHQPEKILTLARIVVFFRPKERSMPSNESKYDKSAGIEWLSVTIPDISASEIRKSSLTKIQDKGWIHPNAFETWNKYINDLNK
ncbi:MAG: nicotinate (nicotinamide) nucleotide adenylyltransferase [Deltaproteobacteria bacterium]|nr:nicotinate (nicotinamide) nucleotide adenylyltransferase [Deltaproteobacteria bacterium]